MGENILFRGDDFLFRDYLDYNGWDVNKLTGDQYAKVVKDYECDKCDLNYPLYNKKQGTKLYFKKYIPKQLLSLYRYVKSTYFIAKSICIYITKKKKYKYSTIYIAAGNRCAGTWLSQILTEVLDGYSNYINKIFDVNSTIVKKIKNKLFVVINHTPPKPSNIKLMDEHFVKYLVTIRDPRDIIVSIYYHMKNYPCGPTSFWDYGIETNAPWPALSRENLSLDKKEFIDVLIEQILPSVLGVMEGWVDYSLLNKNVLILKYEDLKANTLDVVAKILRFYDIEVDDTKIIETIDMLNPKNNNTININYSSGRVPADNKYYLLPHNNWDKHLSIDQQKIIEAMSKNFYKKAGYA